MPVSGGNRSKTPCATKVTQKSAICMLFEAKSDLLNALALGEHLFVLLVGEVVEAEPGKRHVVDGPLPESDGIGRIGIVFVTRGVVEQRNDVHDRPRRNDRLYIIGVVIDNVPVEFPAIDAADRFTRRFSGAF